ncbi:MAG TPA: succinate dehydrogenase assembly factor 2 [Wenzhouxiangella sp.]|nr:succinate dehydrogenase assembly factor 2 [Wenzhouxiangella sp.]
MGPADTDSGELARLRWRCRRGMQELDVMLGDWLQRCWPSADQARRQAFSALLEQEDDRLWSWLSGQSDPDAGLVDIVNDIRARFFGSGR